MSLPAADDFAAGISSPGVFDGKGIAKGASQQQGDQDWFKFHAAAGPHLGFILTKDSGGSVSSSDLFICDASGTMAPAGPTY